MAKARLREDGSVVMVTPRGETPAARRTDWSRFDATTEAAIAAQARGDDDDAARDAARHARGVRARAKLTQVAFARRLGVPVDTVRNWEQGKRAPRGPARALLRLFAADPVVVGRLLERLEQPPRPAPKPARRSKAA